MSEIILHQTEPIEEQVVEQPFEYELLTGHERTDGKWKTEKQLRMEYLQLTDGLIHKMTDGLKVFDHETGERDVKKPDVVVWLDKSARPLSWLSKELWPKLAADPKTGEVPDMPEFKYVNIDREQWVNILDPEGVGSLDINRVDQSFIRSLRSIFMTPKQKEAGLTEDIDTARSSLDGKTIMIVDEVYSTGRTLDYAEKFFQKAFPTAHIGTAYWMKGVAFKEGAKGNADLPVWYKEKVTTGRGVGNRNDLRSSRSNSSTQRLGASFLSTPLGEADPSSDRLRVELKELALRPDVPVLPSFERHAEDRNARYSSYNNGQMKEEVLAAKKEIRSEK